jgi:hypothetical protein
MMNGSKPIRIMHFVCVVVGCDGELYLVQMEQIELSMRGWRNKRVGGEGIRYTGRGRLAALYCRLLRSILP